MKTQLSVALSNKNCDKRGTGQRLGLCGEQLQTIIHHDLCVPNYIPTQHWNVQTSLSTTLPAPVSNQLCCSKLQIAVTSFPVLISDEKMQWDHNHTQSDSTAPINMLPYTMGRRAPQDRVTDICFIYPSNCWTVWTVITITGGRW